MQTTNKLDFQKSVRTVSVFMLYILTAFCFLPSAMGQPVNTLVKDVVMPPPNAASLGKFGDIPISYSSGTPNISIPLHEMREGKLSLPVSLNYHPSGIRVDELASWTGLGWSLDAGGMVSRTVLGKPDEDLYGYWTHGNTIDTSSRSYLCNVYNGNFDGEPDLFSYSIPGFSGKFFFDENNDIFMVPKNPELKVEETYGQGGFIGFVITGPDGTRYIFGKDQVTGATAYETLNTDGISAWRTTWMLLAIETHEGQYRITFNYAQENYSYKSLASCKYVLSDLPGVTNGVSCPGSNGADIPKHDYIRQTLVGQRLTSIVTTTETMDFVAVDDRTDVDGTAKRLGAVEVSTTGFCYRYSFSYDYFEDPDIATYDFPYFRRLKLDGLQKAACDGSVEEGDYVFHYEGPEVNGKQFLPHRLSKAVDHWGYYNGKHGNEGEDVNVPYTTVTQPLSGQEFSYGGSDRDTDGDYMMYGVLNRIDYPTGGDTRFEFEANTAQYPLPGEKTFSIQGMATCSSTPAGTGTDCCGTLATSQDVTFSNYDEISDSRFDLELVGYPNGNCGSCYTSLLLEVYDGSTLVDAYDLLQATCDPFHAGETSVPLSELSAALQPGTSYTFKLTSVNGRGTLDLYHQKYQLGNLPVGGLRIKKVTNHDGIDHGRDMVRTYEYLYGGLPSSPDLTSGRLLNMPVYGISGSFDMWNLTPAYYIFSANSFSAMGEHDGRHLIYGKVTEKFEGNGSVDHHFELDLSQNIVPILGPGAGWYGVPYGPTVPQLYKVTHGQLSKKVTYDASGVEVARSETGHASPSYEEAPGMILKIVSLICGQNIQYYGFSLYSPRTDVYKADWTEETIDEVMVHTDFTYDQAERFSAPVSTSFHNSNGDEIKTEHSFAHDLPSSDLRDAMLELNIIGPVSTLVKVNGNATSGSKTDYGFFDSGTGLPTTASAGNFPYPEKYHSYKGGWYQEGEVLEYSDGLPHRVQMTGWEEETYTWTNGLLTHKNYEGFDWDWLYYQDSRLLRAYTDIDGQSTKYQYDGLMRLREVSARDDKVVTTYEYAYGAPDEWQGGNFVDTKVAYSDFDDQHTRAHFDGLGRPRDSWHFGNGPNGEDIVTEHITYDDQGRVEKSVYLPDSQGGHSYTTFEHEKSPLGRQLTETYPDGSTVGTEYGNEGQYYLLTTTDENGNPTVSKTDILGRQVSVRDALGGSTDYAYDDRNNLTTVTNPEGEQYTYSYDDRNRMVSKHVPGQDGCHLFLYDDRNLLTASRDPNLTLAGKWLGNEYDVYGRVETTGFGTPSTGTGLACGGTLTVDAGFSVGEALIVNTYDGQGLTGEGCSSTYTPIGKLSTTSAATIGPDGTIGGMLATKYCYDDYGRAVLTESNSLAGQDIHRTAYDIADHLLSNERDHGGGEIIFTEANTYDHGGRMTAYAAGASSAIYTDVVSVPGQTLNGDPGGASFGYNSKGQISVKNVAGMAELSYLYNERGWLTHIGQMPFDQDLLPPTTDCRLPQHDPPPAPAPGDLSGDCSSCPEGSVTLAQVLNLRFGGSLNVDCYQDCECAATCDTTEVVPCPDSLFATGSGDTVRMEDLRYPETVYHILKCTGEDDHVTEERLAYVPEQYSVLGRIRIEGEDQQFRVNVDGTDVIMETEQMLAAVQDGTGDVKVETGEEGNNCGTCSPDPPPCSSADTQAQAAALAQIEASLHAPGLTYPTVLHRVRLCSGDEVYLFEEEKDMLQTGTYTVLQEIGVDSAGQELAVLVDGTLTHYDVGFFLCVRDLKTGWTLDYYKPCSENECSSGKQRYHARSVGPTTMFSAAEGDPPYVDLTTAISGSHYSLEADGNIWKVAFGPNTTYGPGENAWDIGVDLPPDADVQSYRVYLLFGDLSLKGVKAGLIDGGQFVNVNGGHQIYEIVESYLPLVMVQPDVLPSLAAIGDMELGLSVINGGMALDAVYVEIEYTGPCDRCVQEELVCTPETEAAQQDSLLAIRESADTLNLSELELPTSLYRVRLCDGTEVYLLHGELERMPEPYQILQVVPVGSLSESFNGGLETVTPTSAPLPRNDLFALKLDYYGALGQEELFSKNGFPASAAEGYRNGNIARMAWQVAGRDQMVYGLSYDGLDRLEYAAYAERGKGSKGAGQFYNYRLYRVHGSSGGISYDGIGNILNLRRGGVTFECDPVNGPATTYGMIDALTYTYANSRLATVQDASGSDEGFRTAPGGAATAFGYDANGNMASDASKGLAVLYNHLNLPREATTAEGTVKWTYDASGRKLRKTVSGCSAGDCVSVDYADGIEFHSSTVNIGGTDHAKNEVHVNHAEGRISYYLDPLVQGGDYWQAEHNLKDHLGNVRLTFADKNRDGYVQVFDTDPVFGNASTPPTGYTEVLQENHYYPFGMLMGGDWREPQGFDRENRYGYNDKELDTDIGLDWHHYGARMYLPEIGRFTGVDPLAEKYAGWSTYSYTFDNPVRFIDPDGRAPEDTGAEDPPPKFYQFVGRVAEYITRGELKSDIKSTMKSTWDAISEVLPDQGTPEAEDFHDSGDSVPGGSEVMTGDNSLNSAGTGETANSENGAKEIVDDMITPGNSMLGKAKVYDGATKASNAIDKAGRVIDNGKKAYDKVTSDEPLKQDTTFEFGGSTITIYKPDNNKNDENN